MCIRISVSTYNADTAAIQADLSIAGELVDDLTRVFLLKI